MTGIACLNNSLSPSYSYALPTWETFHDSICQITIKHPYVTDKISHSGDNAFEIEIAKDISDPDSISMTIEGTCLPDSMPITKEMYNLTLASLKDNYKRIIYPDGTFDKIGPDDESKTYISITGLSGGNEQLKGNSILTAIKNNMTYIVKLNATGEDGNSGFVNNYRYFEDNVLDSLNLTR
jgi:hypothetical protein